MSGQALIHDFAEVVTLTRQASNYQSVILEYDSDFVSGNLIMLDINGYPLGPVPFNTDQATTMTALAVEIATCPDVNSATITGTRKVTIVCNKAATELVITGIVVTGGVNQPEGEVTSKTGGYVNGVWQDVGGIQSQIEMSIQPLNGHEILKLPEGDRTREWIKGYMAAELRTADEATGARGDLITYNGKTYEVMQAERWMQTDLNHYKVLMAEVNSA